MAGERALEDGSRVEDVKGLLNCNVAPVGNLNDAHQVGHRQEGGVVLVVNRQGCLIGWCESFLYGF